MPDDQANVKKLRKPEEFSKYSARISHYEASEAGIVARVWASMAQRRVWAGDIGEH